MTYEALAHRVGLSRTAARSRVQRLFESGAVRVAGIVHPAVLGLTAFAHVSLAIEGPVDEVAYAVAELSDAPYVTVVAGRFGVVAELRSRDAATLAATVDAIRALPGVVAVETLTYTEVLKDPYHPPGQLRGVELDEVDRQVLSDLQLDGRATYADLAVRAGLSPAATRARALRLLEAGVAHVGALVRPSAIGLGHLCGFAVRLDEPSRSSLEQIVALDRVEYLARCLGGADAVGTLAGESLLDVLTTLERIRSAPGVRALESWVHLDLIKESYDHVVHA